MSRLVYCDQKMIDLDACEVVYDTPFTPESLKEDFEAPMRTLERERRVACRRAPRKFRRYAVYKAKLGFRPHHGVRRRSNPAV